MKITTHEFEAAINKAGNPNLSEKEWEETKAFMLKCQMTFTPPHTYIPRVHAALASLDHNKPKKKVRVGTKVWGVIGTIFAILGVIFSGIGTKYLPEAIPSFLSKEAVDNEVPQFQEVELIEVDKLPYNSKKSILDGNLFISQNYNKLIFGGVNFELVQLAIRNSDGEKGVILSIDVNGLVTEAYRKPYIEFSYKDNIYSLKINSDYDSLGEVYLTYELKSLDKETMVLKSHSRL